MSGFIADDCRKHRCPGGRIGLSGERGSNFEGNQRSNRVKDFQAMIEVLKTNVSTHFQASQLIELIRNTFPGYEASFDLDDCDKVLRLVSKTEMIQSVLVIVLIKNFGFYAEILSDELPDEDDVLAHFRKAALN